MVETITLRLPGDLIEQIKSQVSPGQAEVDKFFADAAKKQLRELRIRKLREEYEAAHTRRPPREIYDAAAAKVAAFEAKYGMGTEQFMNDYRRGEIQERDDNWEDLHEWRFACLGLRRMEEKYGFTRGR